MWGHVLTNEFGAAALAAEAADARTSQARLAELAGAHAWLRPLIAENTSAYQELLDWLAALHDPAIDDALLRRVIPTQHPAQATPSLSTAPSAAPALQPVAAQTESEPAAQTPPVSSTTATDAEARPKRRRRLPILIAVAVVVVLVAVGGVTAFRLLQPTSTTVLLQDLHVKPAAVPWNLSGVSFGTDTVEVGTVDQDSSLFFTPNAADPDNAGRLILLDAATRSVRWNVNFPAITQVAFLPGPAQSRQLSGPIVLALSSGLVTSVDLASGKRLSTTTTPHSIIGADTNTGALPSLEGDVLLMDGSEHIERVSSGGLNSAKWKIPVTGEDTPAYVDGKIVVGDHAYSATSGSRVAWSGATYKQLLSISGHLVGANNTDDTQSVFFLNPDTGAVLSQVEGAHDDFKLLAMSAQSFVYQENGRAKAIDLSTGKQRWSIADTSDNTPSSYFLAADAGVLALPGLNGSTAFSVVDEATGEQLYSVSLPEDGSIIPLGIGADTLYVSDGGTIRAIGLRDGITRWTYANASAAVPVTVGGHLATVGDTSGHVVNSLVN